MSVKTIKNNSNLDIDKINQLIDKETDIKIYKKLNFLKLKANGYSTKKAYELANIKKSQAYLTLDQWNNGGYEALLRKKGGGRKTKLNENELNELESIILKNKLISSLEIQKIIKDKWNKEYTIEGIKNLLKTQLNLDLNETEHSLDEITSNLQKHIKNLEDIDISKDDELNTLIYLISREKNSEVLKKLIYLVLRKIKFSNKFASKLFCITPATGNNWLNKWNKYGYESLIRKKGQGRKTKLTDEEIKDLKKN